MFVQHHEDMVKVNYYHLVFHCGVSAMVMLKIS